MKQSYAAKMSVIVDVHKLTHFGDDSENLVDDFVTDMGQSECEREWCGCIRKLKKVSVIEWWDDSFLFSSP